MAKFRSWLWTIVCSREDLQARVSYLTGTEGKKERKIERERERKRETEREREKEKETEREKEGKSGRECANSLPLVSYFISSTES